MKNQLMIENTVSIKSIFKKPWQLILALVLWAAYLTVFFWIKRYIAPEHYIHTRLDDYIPFIKLFFPIYCLWYAYMTAPLIYFYIVSRHDFMKLQLYLMTGFFLCVAFYAVYPNAIDFRPVVSGDDLISRTMRAMYSVDSSSLVTPSMHVFASVAVHLSLIICEKLKNKKVLLLVSFILMTLICASTVLVKQHSVIDIPTGILLAFVLYVPFYGIRRKAQSRRN